MEVIENGNLIGSINGTVVGGAVLMAGKMGLALQTNGVDQYVDFGYQGDTCLGSISLCVHGWVTAFWMQPSNYAIGVIMDIGLYGYERVVIFVLRFNLEIRISSPNNLWAISMGLPSQDDWIHIVVTWQSCDGVKLYIDGELSVMNNSPSDPKAPIHDKPRFVLGASNTHKTMYKMMMDELRVWDTVMNDEEVLALYTADARLNWGIFNRGSFY